MCENDRNDTRGKQGVIGLPLPYSSFFVVFEHQASTVRSLLRAFLYPQRQTPGGAPGPAGLTEPVRGGRVAPYLKTAGVISDIVD